MTSPKALHRGREFNCLKEGVIKGTSLLVGWLRSIQSSQPPLTPAGPVNLPSLPTPLVACSALNSSSQLAGPSPLTTPRNSHLPNVPQPSPSITPDIYGPTGQTTGPKLPRVTNANPGPNTSRVSVALREMLTALDKCVQTIHPLPSISNVLDFCYIFEAANNNDTAYKELMQQLDSMDKNLKRLAVEIDLEPAKEEIAQIAKSIQQRKMLINPQLERNRPRRVFESAPDQGDIENCRREIDKLARDIQARAVIHEVTFQHSRQILQRAESSSKDSLLRRHLSPVEEARHNSCLAVQLGRSRVMEGTRTNVLENACTWAQSPGASKILLLSGGQGTGKSTISYNLCLLLEKQGRLGASYFFTRTSSACSNPIQLIPTLAYQLANSLPVFREALCEVLQKHGNSFSLEPRLQSEIFLIGPLQKAKEQIQKELVIIIDGLDESTDHCLIQQILGSFLDFASDLPIKVFISCRPEPVIIYPISEAGPRVEGICLDDIGSSGTNADIKLYFTETLAALGPSSPTTEQIERLTNLAGNSFTWAVSAMEYTLPHPKEGDPTARLKEILTMASNTDLSTEPYNPCKQLHSLYSTMLEQALNKNPSKRERDSLKLVLWTVICAREPITIQALAGLLGLSVKSVEFSVDFFQFVLHVSAGSRHVAVRHASFSDYLRDHSQHHQFRYEEASHNQFLAECCFAVMQSQLKFNICEVETFLISDSQIDLLADDKIPDELFYACRHWGDHLQVAFSKPKPMAASLINAMLSQFLSEKLLFWVEVLIIRKCIGIGAKMLSSIRSWLLENNICTDIQPNLIDSRNFVTRLANNGCSISSPQIYTSILPYTSRSSWVYQKYWPVVQGLLDITRSTVGCTQDATLARWPAEGPVSALACSPDGTRIVSGYENGSIQLRDTYTGAVIGRLDEGDKGPVCSIKFSRDGKFLISSFSDFTICLYEIAAADLKLVHRLTGHEAPVVALDYSPDNTCIVSGSPDGTVRLRDAETGALIDKQLKSELVIQSIAFSSDGQSVIAMGTPTVKEDDVRTFDAAIQLWDISAPDLPSTVRTLSGHEGPVLSVNLSPDGTCLVTAGADRTIRVWKVDTGAPIGLPIYGHQGEILVAKFSSDGTQIISGAADQTVRAWDFSNGFAIGQPFRGHSNAVAHLVPLPGEALMVSGDDSTIRLWDASTANQISAPGTDPGSAVSVAFSPDSDFVLSGFEDGSMRVWSALDGCLTGTPIKHSGGLISAVVYSSQKRLYVAITRSGKLFVGSILPGSRFDEPHLCKELQTSVLSVTFSDDGSHLITGSHNHTVMIWDSRTLEAIGEPFTAHRGPVNAVASARKSNSHLVISGSGDCSILIHDTASGEVTALSGHESAVLSIACSPDGACIISGSYDKTIRIWDGHNGSEVYVIPLTSISTPGHAVVPWCIVLFTSPAGDRFAASGSDDATVQLWKVDTGTPIGPPLKGHKSPISSVAFSPDGKHIVSGSADGEIRVWDIESRWAFSPGTGCESRTGSVRSFQDPDIDGPSSWEYRDDGWISTRGGRLPLLWASPTHHRQLKHVFETLDHPCSLVISHGFSYGVESCDLTLGQKWNTQSKRVPRERCTL